jgi:hypothetical protein
MQEAERLAESRVIRRAPPANLHPADDELFSDAYSYSTFESFLRQFENVQVSSDSIAYKNFVPLKETLYRSDTVGYYRFRYLAKMLLTARRVRLDDAQDYLLATDQESNGHFHWFTEVLPRLWLVKDRAAEFVPMLADTPYVRSIAQDSFDALGLRFKEIFWMKRGEFYAVPTLFQISKVSRTGQMNDAIMQELGRTFVGDLPRGERRLYVSRARARFRKVLNEPELEERLKDYGFEVVQPDDWPLTEQIAAFSECSTLVGLHGAGLTNCLFMPSGGNVVELRKREPNYGYWHLAESIGHRYFYYHGVPDSELTLIGRGCNLTVDVDDFENAILKKL